MLMFKGKKKIYYYINVIKNIKKSEFQKTLSRNFIVLFLFALILLFTVRNPRFLSTRNLQFILKQGSILLVASVGGTFVILMGSIDLSVGGIASLICVASALSINYYTSNFFSSFESLAVGIVALESIGIGAAFGFLNGFILVKGKIPSFLITMGMGAIAKGISLILTGGYTVPIYISSFKWLANGFIFIFPVLALIAVIFFIINVFLCGYTCFGRYIYAIGGGEMTAKYSGVNVSKVKILVFALAGALYGLSGTLLAARLGAGSAVSGDALTLDVIASVVMGGTSLNGGIGGVSKTIFGVLAISTLSNGLNIVGISPHVQIIIKGIIVILVVFTSIDRSRTSIVK